MRSRGDVARRDASTDGRRQVSDRIACDFLLRGAGELVTWRRRRLAAAPDLGVLTGAALAARDGHIVWIGDESRVTSEVETDDDTVVIDASGLAVLPGFVDAHTHAVFAGDRSWEYAERLRGASYLEILERGGGISETVRATRAASPARALADRPPPLRQLPAPRHDDDRDEDRLRALARGRARSVSTRRRSSIRCAACTPCSRRTPCRPSSPAGPTPTSISSATRSCRRSPAAPTSATSSATRARSRSRRRGACSSARASSATASRSTPSSSPTPAARALAAELGCVSADHLERATADDMPALAAAGVVAVLLPGTSYTLRCAYAPARALLDAGVEIALATDFNPGSSYCENLQTAISLACQEGGLTPDEALRAATLGGAAAIGRARRARQPRSRQGLRPDRSSTPGATASCRTTTA